MASLGNITYTGNSGKDYTFSVYFIGDSEISGSAVYIVTKRVKKEGGGGNHTRIYIGQTDDLKNRFSNHHKQDCFDSHDANCLCIHPENSEETRLSIESDLLDNYSSPCND